MRFDGFLALVLAASLAANGFQAFWNGKLRDDVAAARASALVALDTAKACSAGVLALREAADRQAKEAATVVAAARREAENANRRADRERTRPQAVPGDACASAKEETRQWLERRRTP